jgi:hypothetical protein
MCSLPHSVDHTGDGRNEEAESPFTLSQPLCMFIPAPEPSVTGHALRPEPTSK